MAIVQKRSPPGSGPSLIGRALRDLLGSPDQRDALGGAKINLSEPLPVYRLQLSDIDKPVNINLAQQVGWRYLMEQGGTVAYADLIEKGGSQTFASLSRNRNAERLNQAAHLAETIAAGLPDCEARILDVPALHISAIWLCCSDQKFIPYIDPEFLPKENAPVSVDKYFLDRLAMRAGDLRELLPKGKGG